MKKKYIKILIISLLILSGCKLTNETTTKWVRIPMVMVNNTLYLDTGHTSHEGRCGVMDGKIISSVDASEIPTCNNQSNFGDGYYYQFGKQNETIEILINKKWRIFATEKTKEKFYSNINLNVE